MGALANTGIAEGAANSILRQNNQKELPGPIKFSGSPETAAPDKLSASSIASRKGVAPRRRVTGLIGSESTETLGA